MWCMVVLKVQEMRQCLGEISNSMMHYMLRTHLLSSHGNHLISCFLTTSRNNISVLLNLHPHFSFKYVYK